MTMIPHSQISHLKISLRAPLLFILFNPFDSRRGLGDITLCFLGSFLTDLSGRRLALSTNISLFSLFLLLVFFSCFLLWGLRVLYSPLPNILVDMTVASLFKLRFSLLFMVLSLLYLLIGILRSSGRI